MKDYTKVLTLEELLAQGAFQSIEKKWRRIKRTLNNMQYERLEDSLKEEYFSLANHKLPELIASGFVRAIDQFKKKYINECSEIHCNVDIEKPALVFTFGDDSEDDRDCFVYRCGKTIIKCAEMAEAISTLVVGQECCHWLTAALAIAEKQGVFDGINIEISGSYMNNYDMDIIFSSM
jgi:hypothetical protein